MKQIKKFMLPEHHNKLYTEEAISSMSLVRDVADKINEIIEGINTLSKEDLEWKHEQEGRIRKGVMYMKDNLLNSLNDLMVLLRDSGFIDERIEYHCDNLKARLDNLLNASTVDGELIDVRVGVDDTTYSTAGESVRSQLSNIDDIKVNVGENIIPEGSSINLLKEANIINDGWYDLESGKVVENENTYHFPLYKVKPNTVYTYYRCQIICMFDKNRKFIKSITNYSGDNEIFTTPSNCYYLGVSMSKSSTHYPAIYEGEYTGDFVKGEHLLLMSQIKGLVEELKTFLRGSVGKNIFNKNSSDIVPNAYILYEDGTPSEHSRYGYLYVDVEPNTDYVITPTNLNIHIALFDDNGSYENGIAVNSSTSTIRTTDTTKKMSVSFPMESANLVQVEKGTQPTNYSDYSFGVGENGIQDNSITSSKLSDELKEAIGSSKIIVTVGKNGCDYNSLAEAIENTGENTRFNVYDGYYDVVEEYKILYGASYFDDYVGYRSTNNPYDRGLNLKNNCELVGIGNAEIAFNYEGDNENVKKFFSPLNTTMNNLVKNITLSCVDGSCRYLIHDDYATESGTNIFENIRMSGKPHLDTSMGCGMGTSNTYIIKDCFIKDSSMAIAYHNNESVGKNTLIIKDCYCSGSIRGAHYGSSSEKSLMIVSGCKASNVFVVYGDETTYPNENIELITWNNELE